MAKEFMTFKQRFYEARETGKVRTFDFGLEVGKHVLLPLMGAGAGAIYGGSAGAAIGGVVGTALRYSPNLTRAVVTDRLQKIHRDFIGIQFDKGLFFKPGMESVALMTLETEIHNAKENNADMNYFYGDFYKRHKDEFFLPNAKVMGVRFLPYWQPFGTDIIPIDYFKRDVDPAPTPVTSEFNKGVINFSVDLDLEYFQEPINFGYIHAGKILEIRRYEGKEPEELTAQRRIAWRNAINKDIADEAQQIATNHYIQNPFPSCLKTPIGTRLRGFQRKLGVDQIDFNIQGFIFSDEEQRTIINYLTLERDVTDKGRKDLEYFLNVVEGLNAVANKSNFNPALNNLLREYTNWTRSNYPRYSHSNTQVA
jgi:hypothetical protein